MINELELRIDNIAFYGDQLWSVTREDFAGASFEKAKPMPLTKQIAMELNIDWQPIEFTKTKLNSGINWKIIEEDKTKSEVFVFDIKNLRFYLSEDSVSMHFNAGQWFPKIMDIEYVHTFQNILLDLYLPSIHINTIDRARLNKEGANGWQLINIIPSVNGSAMAFMQREITVPKTAGKLFRKEYVNTFTVDELLVEIHGKEILGELESANYGLFRFNDNTNHYIKTSDLRFKINGNAIPYFDSTLAGIMHFVGEVVIEPDTLLSFILLPMQKMELTIYHSFNL